MTTRAQIAAATVIAIAKLGVSTIKAERLVKVDDWMERAMQKRKPKFFFNIFGTVPLYASRGEAMDAMKEPFSVWQISPYMHLTRYYKYDEEHRLISLSNMAQSAIDDTIWLDMSDHNLLRAYASNWHWLSKEAA